MSALQSRTGKHFNSRPSARGDFHAQRNAAYPDYFNSRPSARGDPLPLLHVSRHAVFQFTPLREGRRSAMRRTDAHVLFQFTPLREGRPDTPAPRPGSRAISIHAPPRGATSCGGLRRLRRRYFNSRPSARGDCSFVPARGIQMISIHAPPRGATARLLNRR